MKCLNVLQIAALAAVGLASPTRSPNSLVVDTAPETVRPYVLRKFGGQTLDLGWQQTIRVSVSGNASDGAFSLFQQVAPNTGYLGVYPHTHQVTHEHFYGTKGNYHVWTQKNESGSLQQGRLMGPGDYAAIPLNTYHTFQIEEPDTEMTLVLYPGGFEKLFEFISLYNFESITGSPYSPTPEPLEPPQDPSVLNGLRSRDCWVDLSFQPRRDFVNGTAGNEELGLNWHNGPNELAKSPTDSSFVAKDRGPKYLNTDAGYKVIQPIVPAEQSEGNMTMGTVIMSLKLDNITTPVTVLKNHTAFVIEEGQLDVVVEGFDKISLGYADTLFVPAGTPFTYEATIPFTKFLYVTGGPDGVQLLDRSIPWDSISYPAYAGFQALPQDSSAPQPTAHAIQHPDAQVVQSVKEWGRSIASWLFGV